MGMMTFWPRFFSKEQKPNEHVQVKRKAYGKSECKETLGTLETLNNTPPSGRADKGKEGSPEDLPSPSPAAFCPSAPAAILH